MSEPEKCGGCGQPGWTNVVVLSRMRLGAPIDEPAHNIGTWYFCDACVERLEGKGAAPAAVPASRFVRTVDDDRR